MNRGTGLRQGCGQRRFATEIAAEKALAKSRSLPGAPDDDRVVVKCAVWRCDGWHLETPCTSAAGKARKDTIPPKVRRLVNKRDRWCQMCGATSWLEQHHRRPKQMGGDPRPHADCPCCLVRVCRECHRWIHRSRREAEARGLLMAAEVTEPGRVSVMRGSEDGGGAAMFPTCSGEWVSECPYEAGEAA